MSRKLDYLVPHSIQKPLLPNFLDVIKSAIVRNQPEYMMLRLSLPPLPRFAPVVVDLHHAQTTPRVHKSYGMPPSYLFAPVFSAEPTGTYGHNSQCAYERLFCIIFRVGILATEVTCHVRTVHADIRGLVRGT